MSRAEAVRDAQRAFVGLLEQPLVTSSTNPPLYRLVLRNLQAVTEFARRPGYRIQRIGRAVRLIRVPVAGTVSLPPRPADAPGRRLLALICCLAACCEEVSGTVTLQRLSDMVRDLCATPGVHVTAYDPDDRAQRRQLRAAAEYLDQIGVLRRRTSDDRMLDDWIEGGTGPGAGYEVDRDPLLLMTSADVLALALNPEPADPDTLNAARALRQLRDLLELPAVLYAGRDPEDADLLRRQRGFRATDLAQMTGGTVEARTEGLLLVLTDDERVPATVVDWPRAKAADWVALLMADIAGRDGTRHQDGTVTLTSDQVDEVADDLLRWRGDYMNKLQKTVPGTVRADAEAKLSELGLLTVTGDGGWVLSPVVGRYRDPDVTLTDPAEPAS
ncbi:TIGR02678 family protein [Couchioplanes caeruleus]|uniref:TIGR02678 family protein n=1 Tax=Couchioplanes caeruleus TaxID=56438 RepID=UPI0020BE522D|nr:TIGR02678 family protein [Couchioplanes caeruleus]UQU62532.1 TIGR02678 family protein [Couchioplanes caeruleus]